MQRPWGIWIRSSSRQEVVFFFFFCCFTYYCHKEALCLIISVGEGLIRSKHILLSAGEEKIAACLQNSVISSILQVFYKHLEGINYLYNCKHMDNFVLIFKILSEIKMISDKFNQNEILSFCTITKSLIYKYGIFYFYTVVHLIQGSRATQCRWLL